jgi:hypothetical protein
MGLTLRSRYDGCIYAHRCVIIVFAAVPGCAASRSKAQGGVRQEGGQQEGQTLHRFD